MIFTKNMGTSFSQNQLQDRNTLSKRDIVHLIPRIGKWQFLNGKEKEKKRDSLMNRATQ